MTKQEQVEDSSTIKEIDSIIRARVPLTWVLTHEENRFITDLATRVAKPQHRPLYIWSLTQGLVEYDQYRTAIVATGAMADTKAPPKLLDTILTTEPKNDSNPPIFVLRDFHTVLQTPIARRLRDIYELLANDGKCLIIVSPILAYGPAGEKMGMSPTLEKQMIILDYDLPSVGKAEELCRVAIKDIVDQHNEINTKPTLKVNYTKPEYRELATAVSGLSQTEIENSISTCLASQKKLDPLVLVRDKRQIIKRSQILEYVDNTVKLEDLGGLDLAKDYFTVYASANTPEAIEFGVEPLRGILLTGIPGTGKSALAKAAPLVFKQSCLRLDIGRVMAKLVGQSESRMRDAIKVAEAMAPTILWIDEVEKSLSGTKSSSHTDGGTMARVFGTLLTAMEEGMKGVTVIATANDISRIPPEFIRRFNEVFFVDLPGPEERWDIIGIHLRKRKRDLENYRQYKDQLLEVSEKFTGAEIEKAIQASIATAFYNKCKDITAEHILTAFSETKPIAVIQPEKIIRLQKWALDHARYASSWSEKKNRAQADTIRRKVLDLDETLGDLSEIKTSVQKNNEAKVLQTAMGGRKIDIG